MKKTKCELCGKVKARRKCQVYHDKFICSPCCADLRNDECEGCRHYQVASQYHSSKDQKKSAKHFTVELNEEVENAVDRALELVERGKIDKARDILNKLEKRNPRNHMVMYGLGAVYAVEGQNDDAIRYFTRATEIFPYFIQAYYNLGVAYKKNFDVKNSVESMEKVIEIGDADNEVVQQAKDLIDFYRSTILKISNISLEDFLTSQEKFDAAFSHMEKGQWEKAIFGFKECLEIVKSHPQSYGNLGICYAQLGQKSKALAALDKALEIDPNYEPAIANKAMVERIQEGEKSSINQFESIDYYKEYPLKKKSYLESLLNRFTV